MANAVVERWRLYGRRKKPRGFRIIHNWLVSIDKDNYFFNKPHRIVQVSINIVEKNIKLRSWKAIDRVGLGYQHG